jgi:predicted polyphosphate/ATP-dependent NAD kinase
LKKIGIIANPNSGKDIRRLFSYAITIGNNEKANMVERMILGAQDLGVEKIYIMPDPYNIGSTIRNTLELNEELKAEVEVLDIFLKNNWEDTVRAAEKMESLKVDCIIVLGGDGTSRLLGKTHTQVPIISVSTGTNNVYPEFLEGTVAGMAAAAYCHFGENSEYVNTDKAIDIYVNGSHEDVALVDVAITDNRFVGSRALWDINEIREVIVTRSHPSAIGFSSAIGVDTICYPEDDFGFRMSMKGEDKSLLVPFSPGKMTAISVGNPIKMYLDQMYVYKSDHKGTLALDGERTVVFSEGDTLGFVIRRHGPKRIDVKKVLEHAVKKGFFQKNR